MITMKKVPQEPLFLVGHEKDRDHYYGEMTGRYYVYTGKSKQDFHSGKFWKVSARKPSKMKRL